jgi:hypothetical protein
MNIVLVLLLDELWPIAPSGARMTPRNASHYRTAAVFRINAAFVSVAVLCLFANFQNK